MTPPPIERLSEPARQAFADAGSRRRFERGDVVVREGDVGDSLHLVARGRVAMRVSAPERHDVTFHVLSPGEFFGEMALFGSRTARAETVAALEPVETLELARAPFEQLRAAHPEVNDLFLLLLAERAARLTSLVQEAYVVGVQQRVARRLFEVGLASFDGVLPVVVPLTQDEVADLAGTTRPTANAALQALQERGALRLARGRVEIVSPAVLRSATGWD